LPDRSQKIRSIFFETDRHIDLLRDDSETEKSPIDNLVWISSGSDPEESAGRGPRNMEARDPNGMLFMAPFAARSLDLRSEALGKEVRLDLLELAFSYVFGMMKHHAKCCATSYHITEDKIRDIPRQTLWPKAACRRTSFRPE
jgi:hypothetical protein